MQQRSSSPDAMREQLRDPAVQQSIQRQLESIHKDLATTIGKAAELVGVPEAKLRYWESVGLLAPSRSNQASQAADRSRQRYYGMDHLTQAVIIKELEKTHSLVDIKEFIKDEAPFIERLIKAAPITGEQTQEVQSVARGIYSAEEALLWEFFLPRALYLSLCLLFGQEFTGNGGIYLPVWRSGASQASISVTRAANLSLLGEGLLGWREPDHAFFTDVFKEPPPELASKYDVIPLKELLPVDSSTQPVSTHLMLEPRFAALLRQADMSKRGIMEARIAAGRILQFLQDQHLRWRSALHAQKSALLYDSPTLTHPQLGGPLLNEMAEVIVELGGRDKETQQRLWRFCCILLPEDMLLPLMARTLAVKGQSKASPYKVSETKLAPGRMIGPGLSILAYQSGSTIYRPHITSEDPAIALREREEPIGSAIAIPIEGAYGRALGVLYVVSHAHDAFSLDSQQLLRVFGRVLGELVTSSNSRSLASANLSDQIENPEIIDPILRVFHSINTFRSDLQTLLQTVKQSNAIPFRHFACVAIDIDGLSKKALKYGDQAATRNLVDAVGQRIRTVAQHIFADGRDMKLYRAYVDRFYLLLKDMAPEQIALDAVRLKDALKEPYFVYARRVLPEQLPSPESLVEFHITARLGVTCYSYEALKEKLRTAEERDVFLFIDRFERNLFDALAQGKGKGGDVVMIV